MKREKEVPAELLAYLENHKQEVEKKFNTLTLFCTVPIRAVKMKMLVEDGKNGKDEDFRTAIIPATDIYVADKAVLKKGFLKRNALAFFISGTKTVFPYGHIYAHSGYICLGNIFVPSAVPERSATMPMETLFLHNDRNLSHGDAHLLISAEKAKAIGEIIEDAGIRLGKLASIVIDNPGTDIIKHDEIWSLSADVAVQKSLPEALRIMSKVYNVIFKVENKEESEEQENG